MFKWLSLCVALLAFVVIGMGAYTRLSDAGLGCPDWPGCYGHILVHSSIDPHPPTKGFVTVPAVDQRKAWIEMIHRYLAGTLGAGMVVLATASWIKR